MSYSSVRGVIFFSSTSSSAKFFWYFSQFWPVAEGYVLVSAQTSTLAIGTAAYHDERRGIDALRVIFESSDYMRPNRKTEFCIPVQSVALIVDWG